MHEAYRNTNPQASHSYPLSTMDRTEVEKITQSPLTFKSTFSVSPAAVLSIDTVPIRSEKCGLGWAFRIEKTNPLLALTGQPVSRRAKKGVKVSSFYSDKYQHFIHSHSVPMSQIQQSRMEQMLCLRRP